MSGFEFNATLDVKEVKKAFHYLQNEAINKAAARSLNRAGAKAMTTARREISKKIGLQQKAFKKNIVMAVKANRYRLLVVIKATGKHINLIEFVAPSKAFPGAFRKKKGVTVKEYGKRREIKGTFIGRGLNSGKALVLKRRGAAALPVDAKYGPSIPKSFINKYVLDAVEKEVAATWQKEFARNIKYYIGKM